MIIENLPHDSLEQKKFVHQTFAKWIVYTCGILFENGISALLFLFLINYFFTLLKADQICYYKYPLCLVFE